MLSGPDYIREIQKFTTSQYWNTGVRITAGVMVPSLIFFYTGWLAAGMPFLWGALFASLTDTPGPVRHRRNGLLAAIGFNTVVTAITLALSQHPSALFAAIIFFTFFFSLFGVYGARASAVGTLALVIMLIHLAPEYARGFNWLDPALVAAGGIWYALLGLALYRLWPYRLAEQAIGENLIDIAEYLRARAAFYKAGTDVQKNFDHVMEVQVALLKKQEAVRELLLKTRQFVVDTTPRSRSLMMVFLDSVELFENTISTYQNYNLLQQKLGEHELMNKLYGLILQVAAEMELAGLAIQSGRSVKKPLLMQEAVGALQRQVADVMQQEQDTTTVFVLQGLRKTLSTLESTTERLQRIVAFARMELDTRPDYAQQLSQTAPALTPPIHWRTLFENLSLDSNDFRHAVRLTVAVAAGYFVSFYLSVHHTYWILLTIVTILRPVYALSRKRNQERLLGTLAGAAIATGVLFVVKGGAALLALMIFAMIMSYSLLRVNYLGFVLFLTVYLVITFHFLHPVDLNSLVRERLVDTFLGSVIAALASRFILPVWTHEQLDQLMLKMTQATGDYFREVVAFTRAHTKDGKPYARARNKAIVALTNLSDGFQRMISEPHPPKQATLIHQFVIASHMITSHLTALSTDKQAHTVLLEAATDRDMNNVLQNLEDAGDALSGKSINESKASVSESSFFKPLALVQALALEMKTIALKMQ